VLFVGPVADLVKIDPSQLAVELGVAGVEGNALVTEEFAAVFHPAPALLGRVERDRDVVGHVPGLKDPDTGEAGLKVADKPRKLIRVKEMALLFELRGSKPEIVDQRRAPEGEHGGEHHRGAGGLWNRGSDQMLALALLIE